MINLSRYSEPLKKLIENDSRLLNAAEFVDTYNPSPESKSQYNWVTTLAPKLYDSRLVIYQKLDDKAASVVTWVVAASGWLATGIIVGVCEGRIHWFVAICTAPSLVLAALSVRSAVYARIGRDLWPVPDVKVGIEYTNTHADDGELMDLEQWHLAIESISSESDSRSIAISSSLMKAYRGLVCLSLPLIAVIIMQIARNNTTPTEPTTPFATNQLFKR